MRFMLIATVVAAAAMLFDLRASRAYEGPWCALTNRGRAMVADCSMRTLEMCVQEVIAGNRGFCNPNPRWPGHSGSEARQPRTQRKRYNY